MLITTQAFSLCGTHFVRRQLQSRAYILVHFHLLTTVLLVLQTGTADDGAGGKIYINRYDAVIAEKEEDAAYAVSMRTPKIPVVINEGQKNQYGSPRGYKIQLNRPLLNLEPTGYERSKALGELMCCLLLLVAQPARDDWTGVITKALFSTARFSGC